jgi:hypothetical protein
VVVLASMLMAPAALAQDGRRDPAVVDRSEVLTANEREFLANAVQDVRERTPYLASVVIVARMEGRAPGEVANQLLPRSDPGDQLPVALVLAPGNPPRVAVTAPPDLVEEFDAADDLAHALERAREEAASGGVGQAGLGFTGGLIEGAPDEGGAVLWILWLVTFLILAVSAFRTYRERQRVGPLPDDPTPIGSAVDGPVLVHGHIAADQALGLSLTDDLVWYEAEETRSLRRYTHWRNAYGDTWATEDGRDVKVDRRSNGVPFRVEDGTGAAAVNPVLARVWDAPRLEKTGGFFSENSFKLRGLRLGDAVTVAGPAARVSERDLVIEGRWGGEVMITTKPPAKAVAAFRRRLVRRYVWTGFWLVVFLASLTVQPA